MFCTKKQKWNKILRVGVVNLNFFFKNQTYVKEQPLEKSKQKLHLVGPKWEKLIRPQRVKVRI